jgi:hypothetical protein
MKWGLGRDTKIAIVLAATILCSVGAYIAGVKMTYDYALREGYSEAMNDVATNLQKKGYDFRWHDFGNGTYSIEILGYDNAVMKKAIVTCDLSLQIYDKYGHLKYSDVGAGTFTDQGKNWTIAQLSGGYANTTQMMQWISQSNSSAGLSATSTILPTEKDCGGMSRVQGQFNWMNQTSGSYFFWNVTNTFSITQADTIVVWGFNWQSVTDKYALSTSGSINPKGVITAGHNLIWYDTTPGSKNMAVGDIEIVTGVMSIAA